MAGIASLRPASLLLRGAAAQHRAQTTARSLSFGASIVASRPSDSCYNSSRLTACRATKRSKGKGGSKGGAGRQGAGAAGQQQAARSVGQRQGRSLAAARQRQGQQARLRKVQRRKVNGGAGALHCVCCVLSEEKEKEKT